MQIVDALPISIRSPAEIGPIFVFCLWVVVRIEQYTPKAIVGARDLLAHKHPVEQKVIVTRENLSARVQKRPQEACTCVRSRSRNCEHVLWVKGFDGVN